MQRREKLFQAYCDVWLTRDGSRLGEFFTDDALYVESDGSRYEGLGQIRAWFAAWLPHGEVLAWQVRRYLHQCDASAAEWTFRCRYDGVESEFDGVTLMTFSSDGKISCLREFAAKACWEKTAEPFTNVEKK